MKKTISLLVVFTMILVWISGCSSSASQTEGDVKSGSTASDTAIPNTSQTEQGATTEPAEESTVPGEEPPDFSDFRPLDREKIGYLQVEDVEDFNITRFSGSFDLDADGGEEEVVCEYTMDSDEATLAVNDVEFRWTLSETDSSSSILIAVVDIDTANDICDLLIIDWGDIGGEISRLVRFEGDQMTLILESKGIIYTDEEGTLITSEWMSRGLTPGMVFSWCQLTDGKIIEHSVSRDHYFGDRISFEEEVNGEDHAWVVTAPEEAATAELAALYEKSVGSPGENAAVALKGATVTLLDVGSFEFGAPNWYYVEFYDGSHAIYFFEVGQ